MSFLSDEIISFSPQSRVEEGRSDKCEYIVKNIQTVAERKGFLITYNRERRRVIVLDSHSLCPKVFFDNLYTDQKEHLYRTLRLYPLVDEKRNSDGNLEIEISNSRPKILDDVKNGLPQTLSSNRQSLVSSSPGFQYDSGLVGGCCPTVEEIAEMEKCIASNLIDIMNQFLNKHEGEKGIWYGDDFNAYLKTNCGKELEESFYDGFVNEEFFEKTAPFTFALKNGKTPSEALLSFLSGPTITDCGNALTACYEECFRRIIGDEKYNALRSEQFVMAPITIVNPKSSIHLFSSYSKDRNKGDQGIIGKRPLKPGEECYFQGVPQYFLKHPTGCGCGWNVVYIGDDGEDRQLFMGHGFEKPLTEVEIYQKLIGYYNEERTARDETWIAKQEDLSKYDRNQNQDLRNLYTVPVEEAEKDPCQFIGGFLIRSIQGLIANDCVILKKLPLSDCVIFKSWKGVQILFDSFKTLSVR